MAVVLLFYFWPLLFHPAISQNPAARPLLKFKHSLSKSDSLTTWKKNDPCDPDNVWTGIVCIMDDVTSINLAGMGLRGTPDVASLAPLDDLKVIRLDNNSLVGPIPAFNLVPSLKAIYASKNQFSGDIPSDYFQPLHSLRKLWLSENQFSGPIPDSLRDLSKLKQLHLERNEFSGRLPDFQEIGGLDDLDLSNNRLEGPIPGPMNKFDARVFENNPNLCGPKASRDCAETDLYESESTSTTKLMIVVVVVTLLIWILSVKDKREEEENMRIVTKEDINHQAMATVPSSSGYASNSNSKKATDSPIQSTSSSPRAGRVVGELVMVNEDKGLAFGSQDLMKASAELLGNGGLGSAYKATMANGVSVVVRRVKEIKKMSKDEFDAEIKKLGRLKQDNLLRPLGYQIRKDDKFLVCEYVPKGSLQNLLHGDHGHNKLTWTNRLKIIKGVARAMGYLHSELASHELPHGNLKSCNILIRHDYEPLVTDYALHPLINPPAQSSMFAYKSPEATHLQQVSHKSDVYCLGIIILEIVTGKYPSQYLTNNQKGGTDVVQWVRSAIDEKRERELIDPGLAKESVEQIEKLLHVGAACTESDVHRRIDMKEAITRIEEMSV